MISTNAFRPVIAVTSDRITVDANYNYPFRVSAQRLGGVYRGKVWSFSAKEEIAVREACERHYGYDGITEPPLIDVEISFLQGVTSDPLRSVDVLGRPLARMNKISRKPVIASGTVIQSGRIVGHDEHAVIEAGTVVIFRDVPIVLFNSAVSSAEIKYKALMPDNLELEHCFYEHDQLVKRIKELETIFSMISLDPSWVNSRLSQKKRDRLAAKV